LQGCSKRSTKLIVSYGALEMLRRVPAARLGLPARHPYDATMELHGTVEANLVSAIASAKRLRGHPVHQDTISHWSEILQQARRELAENEGDNREVVMQLVAELETELADR
jgi:hypothetical protein